MRGAVLDPAGWSADRGERSDNVSGSLRPLGSQGLSPPVNGLRSPAVAWGTPGAVAAGGAAPRASAHPSAHSHQLAPTETGEVLAAAYSAGHG